MKKLLFTFVLFVIAFAFKAESVQAQDNYKTAIGARLGSPLSLSVKHFAYDNLAVEGTLGWRGYSNYSWTTVGLALQMHNEINGVDGLAWYYGGGLGGYFWSYDSGFTSSDDSSTSFALKGFLGLDYTFDTVPINLSLDWVPTIFLNGYNSGFGADYGALAVRYTLGR